MKQEENTKKVIEELKKVPIDELKSIEKQIIDEEELKEEKEKGKFKPNKLKSIVLELLATRQKNEATESVINEIKRLKRIYTIRDDKTTEIWIYNKGIYIPEGKSFIKAFTRILLGNAFTTHFCNEVIAKIEADTFIEADKFFNINNPEEVAVENGLLNITTRRLRAFTNKEIFFNKLPVTYNPKKKCPFILKHFNAVLKNKDDVPVMEEIMGYLLLKEYRIEKAFMFSGTGRNGKGKTLELMKRFIGADNCVSVPLQQLEDDMFSLGELCNKMANLAGDIDKKALNHTGNFKNLTGRDTISAARKFLSRIHFVNYAKLIFCANAIPITYDESSAFWNRWVLLEFPYTFLSEKEYGKLSKEEKKSGNFKLADPMIIEKMSGDDELSGLLNVALDGLDRLLEQKDFSYSKSIEQVKEMWIRKSNSFAAFLMDEIEEDFDSKITKNELRKAYSHYCKEFKLKMSGDKIIKAILTSTYGVGEGRERESGNRYYWDGIGFKSAYPAYDSHGFSTYTKFVKFPLESKRVGKVGSLGISNDKKKGYFEDKEKKGGIFDKKLIKRAEEETRRKYKES